MTIRPGLRPYRLPRIDGGPGPAERIRDDAAAAMVSTALQRHAQRTAPVSRVRRYAAAAAIVCALAGVSAAALFRVRTEQLDSARPASRPVSPISVGPAADSSAPPTLLPSDDISAPQPRANRVGREPTSNDLLDQANRLRRRGDWRAAARLYARVAGGVEPWPRYIAAAAAASIELEHLAEPRRALSLYRQALADRPGGELEPEILWGIAVCQRALGDLDQEASALRDLLIRHATSPFRGRVERRLSELAAPTAASR